MQAREFILALALIVVARSSAPAASASSLTGLEPERGVFHATARTWPAFDDDLHPVISIDESRVRWPGNGGMSLQAAPWDDDESRDLLRGVRREAWSGTSRHFSWNEERWQEAECEGEWIGFFAACGEAPGDRREAARLEGGGVTLLGLIPARDADALGVGCMRIEFDDAQVRPRDCATAIETFYSVRLCSWLRLTPDFQVLVRPSGFAKDSVVFGIRAWIAL